LLNFDCGISSRFTGEATMTSQWRKWMVRGAFAASAIAVLPGQAFAQDGEGQDIQALVETCQSPGDDIEAAIEACSSLLDMRIANDPKFRNGMIVSRGMQYLRLKDYAKARENFEEALGNNPESGGGLYGLGLVKVATGKEAEGQADMDRAVKIAPAIPAYFDSLGLTRPARTK
jgi:tetratricopeptide (TPR) repeat protein